MRSLSICLGLVLSVAACGPKDSDRDPVKPDPKVTVQSGNGSGSGTGANAAALTDKQCSALFDHVLAIGVEELRRTKPPEEVPTDKQVDEIKAAMMDKDLERCRAQPVAAYECAMLAKTSAELGACDKAR